MTKNLPIALLAAAALATGAVATPAFAGTEDAAQTRVAAVHYGDLDLSTDSGRRALQRRIEVAARDVCGMSERVTGSMIPSSSARACYVETRANMDREIAAHTDRQQQRG